MIVKLVVNPFLELIRIDVDPEEELKQIENTFEKDEIVDL
jgi:hypothetical protein